MIENIENLNFLNENMRVKKMKYLYPVVAVTSQAEMPLVFLPGVSNCWRTVRA